VPQQRANDLILPACLTCISSPDTSAMFSL
jgi:hypothetical protein